MGVWRQNLESESGISLRWILIETVVSRPLRIAQVSDCHLPASAGATYRGINAYENLELVLQKVADFAPDVVLATGDLSEDASPSSYRALKQYFSRYFSSLEVNVLALPGNHDDPQSVAYNLFEEAR